MVLFQYFFSSRFLIAENVLIIRCAIACEPFEMNINKRRFAGTSGFVVVITQHAQELINNMIFRQKRCVSAQMHK